YAELEQDDPGLLAEWEDELAALKTPFDRDLVEWTLAEMEKDPQNKAKKRQRLRFLRRACLSPERSARLAPRDLRKMVSATPSSSIGFQATCVVESSLQRMDKWAEGPASLLDEMQMRLLEPV